MNEGDRVTIEDFGSKNGTLVKSVRIERKVEIHDGDEIRIGPVPLTARVTTRSEKTKTASVG